MLVGRWGIFWRPLRTTVDKAAQIVLTCMKLHDFVLDNEDHDIPLPCGVDTASHTQYPDYQVYEQSQADTQQPRLPRTTPEDKGPGDVGNEDRANS
jgi:hypothetical protein